MAFGNLGRAFGGAMKAPVRAASQMARPMMGPNQGPPPNLGGGLGPSPNAMQNLGGLAGKFAQIRSQPLSPMQGPPMPPQGPRMGQPPPMMPTPVPSTALPPPPDTQVDQGDQVMQNTPDMMEMKRQQQMMQQRGPMNRGGMARPMGRGLGPTQY